MGLIIHRAERADRLVEALAGVVRPPMRDPFVREVIAVHSRGIERWLQQELSHRLGTGEGRDDGVCANVDFPFPSRVIGRALAAATGIDPDEDPWPPERLVWPLLEVVDVNLGADWLDTLSAHLGDGAGRRGATDDGADGDGGMPSGRRFGAVRHIADLFDRYGVHRPEMVCRWANGDVVLPGVSERDVGFAWQPRLWREVHRLLRVPSPAERLDEAVDNLRGGTVDDEKLDLPERLSIFGLTALPNSYVSVLSALAEHRDVHLFLLHPSPALWAKVGDAIAQADGVTVRRDDDPSRGEPAHPLLASWGRDAREMQLVVARAHGETAQPRHDHLPLDAPKPATLLARLQADVRADRDLHGPAADDGDGRPELEPTDASLQVHACHGRTRQVEVLRDAVLHLLADDPTLEPRDIVVMCPDIETFAPLVHAVFGAHAVAEGELDEEEPTLLAERLPDLRVRLADRSIRNTNPVLRVVAELLRLPDSRLTATELLDLAGREPVRRRFRFDDEDLERLESWVADARIRWGLDAEHRAGFDLGDIEANTWRAGLDRILAGVTMADEEERLLAGVVPLDDVEGSDVDLAGRVSEFLDRLGTGLDLLADATTVAGWRDAILEVARSLTATRERDRWQRLQLERLLGDVVDAAAFGGRESSIELSLQEVRTLLEDRLRGRPSRANHRTGDLTVCTLVPMRSVPHRVVCLLGMDDGSFPRRTSPDGDDLISRDPHVGDRDPRTEDRQLLLDALLAATDHLVVTYTGRDERTNEPHPPAVPIGELLDVVDRTVRHPKAGHRARDLVVTEHPLQTSDARNFRSGALVEGRLWGFDPSALAGARARAAGTPTEHHFLSDRLDPAEESETLALDDLVRFAEHPVKAFLRQRLNVSLPSRTDEPTDAIPVELGGLEKYAVGDRLLTARLSAADLDEWVRAERARGTLPPGALAEPFLEEVTGTVDLLLAAAEETLGRPVDLETPRSSLEVVVPLAEGRTLVGTVPNVAGDVLLTLQYSRVAAKHRLAAWVRLVAATLAHPDRELCAVTIGRSKKRSRDVRVARVGPLGDSAAVREKAARSHLDDLVWLFDRGMTEPLPLFCATSAAYAAAVADDDEDDPAGAAFKEWTTSWKFPNEDLDPEHVLVLGGQRPFDELLLGDPRDDECGEGWAAEEASRFGRYARRLWDPILGVEEVSDV